MLINATDTLNQEEIDVYDRQIRIWGHDVQKKLKNYNILLIGLSGIGWESAKNLILYGIKSLTLYETEEISYADLSTNLYLTSNDIGKNRAEVSLQPLKMLNPNVQILCCQDEHDMQSEQFLKKFDIVIMNDIPYYAAKVLNKKMHKLNIQNVYTRSFDNYGFIFYDFITHSHPETLNSNGDLNATNKQKNNYNYPGIDDLFKTHESFEKLMAMKRSNYIQNMFICIKALFKLEDKLMIQKLDIDTHKQELENHIKSILKSENFENDIFHKVLSKSEFNPTCSVIAGFLCQELIKILSDSKPAGNIMLYNGDLYKADTLQFFM